MSDEDSIVIKESDLWISCPKCFGSGESRFSDTVCPECEGYGHHLTPTGQVLIKFLSKRGFGIPMSPKSEEELRGMEEQS
jgi:DnaJ-class molecular chaperone